MRFGWLRFGVAAASALALAACDPLTTSPRPEQRAALPATPKVVEPSARSKALASYYANVQRQLLSQGLLRKDGGGPDTPFSKRILVQNFVQIGVFNEFTFDGDRYEDRRSEGRVQRWDQPVQLTLDFGEAVPADMQADARSTVASYASRLSRVTGLDIALTPQAGNFTVAVLTVDELEAYGPRLMQLFPGLSETLAQQITSLPRPIYCAVYAFSDADNPDSFQSAVAIIRAEHPKLLRDSCFHEEIAQGLGLSNDSPAARPSIFNDDDEFALLTRHDELLLEILYDDRLPLGATPDQARPVVEVIAADLLGGDS
jgi:hypothetical protein